MIGKVIGAALGGKLAQQTKSVGGTTGAMIGAAAPFVLSRLSIPAKLALGVGGYFTKKFLDKKNSDMPEPTNPKIAPVASVPQPATPAIAPQAANA